MKVLLGERLRMLRLERGLNQTQLADGLQTTQRKISYWEMGKTEPDIVSILKICEYFDVSADFLLGRKDY